MLTALRRGNSDSNGAPAASGTPQDRAVSQVAAGQPGALLTRKTSSSFSVKLADRARSHRSITRGSSNSGREQGSLRDMHGLLRPLGRPPAWQPEPCVCACA